MFEHFFKPRGVAVVGASSTPGKVGFDVMRNLINSRYPGRLYPVNTRYKELFGFPCYKDIDDIEGPLDLAVFMIPPKFIPDVLEKFGRRGGDAAIVISAGFKEVGPEGARMEKAMLEVAQKHGIRILGPNCLGVIDTAARLNASFAAGMPAEGNIGFISQSGALGTAILDWSFANGVGFSRFVSLGNKADIDEVDMLEALGRDKATDVIIGYIEGTSRGRRFMETLLKITKKKPVVLIKSGTSEAGARAASSHTGSIAGSETAFEAAFRQAGIMRARTVEELFDYAVAFANQPLPKGNGIAVLTNAGGPGIMAADAVGNTGVRMARLQSDIIKRLKEKLPPAAAFNNPVDVIGDASAQRYADALNILLDDPGVHGVAVILTPQGMTQIEETAKAMAYASMVNDKPIFGAFMGEENVRSGLSLLQKSHIPAYSFPERAVRVFARMSEYAEWKQLPAEKPVTARYNKNKVKEFIEEQAARGRHEVGGEKALELIRRLGIRIPRYETAEDLPAAKKIAARMGYPVVMKVASPDISHKSDVGGVVVGIRDQDALERAYKQILINCQKAVPTAVIHGVEVHEMVAGGKELIVGMNRDPQFGPLVMFGLGGIYVEILKDVSVRIAPFTESDLDSMIHEIRSVQLLTGARGEKPKDIPAVKEVIRRIARLSLDFESIIEMDINPLMVRDRGDGVYAVDARFTFDFSG